MQTIGITELVSFGKNYPNIPAKIDTGADRSAIWASKIHIDKNHILRFCLFDEGSTFYTGKVFKRKDFGVAEVKSSNGAKQIRYRTSFTVSIGDRKIRTLFYLSDRSTQKFPVLIGRRTLHGKYVVDVTKKTVKIGKRTGVDYTKTARKDPHAFHEKHKKDLAS